MRSYILCALWVFVWYPLAMKLGFSFSEFSYWLILIFGVANITLTVRD